MKKGQSFGLSALITVVLIFLVAGLVAIYSIDILNETREDFCDYTYDTTNGNCISCNSSHANYNESDGYCHNTTAGLSGLPAYYRDQSFNSTSDSIDGVAKIPDKLPTIGNVVVAAIIIGVLLAAFGGFLASREFRG